MKDVIDSTTALVGALTALLIVWFRIWIMLGDVKRSVNGLVEEKVHTAARAAKAEGKLEGLEKAGAIAPVLPPPRKILIVDDDEDVITLFSLILSNAGYLVIAAREGISALQTVQRDRPDLILLDVRLPWMDGMEVLSRVRKITSAPVILVTGDSARIPEDEQERTKVLLKPVEPIKLLTAVGAVFRDHNPSPTPPSPGTGNSPSEPAKPLLPP